MYALYDALEERYLVTTNRANDTWVRSPLGASLFDTEWHVGRVKKASEMDTRRFRIIDVTIFQEEIVTFLRGM